MCGPVHIYSQLTQLRKKTALGALWQTHPSLWLSREQGKGRWHLGTATCQTQRGQLWDDPSSFSTVIEGGDLRLEIRKLTHELHRPQSTGFTVWDFYWATARIEMCIKISSLWYDRCANGVGPKGTKWRNVLIAHVSATTCCFESLLGKSLMLAH